MHAVHRAALVFTVSSLILSCATGSQNSSPRPRGSRTIINQEELAELPVQTSAHDAVRRLRPAWLRSRAGNLGGPFPIQVYVNNMHTGTLDYLHTRQLEGIIEIRYYSASDATTRWGTGVSGGAIEIITQRRD